ncbi:ABC-three component system middle component 6 [Actinokineospora sp. 24-640]
MYLPTKAVAADQALVTLGAQIIEQLETPGTVSAVWDRLQRWRVENKMTSAVPFWWFALALDGLYAVGGVEFSGDQLVRRMRA